MSDISDYNHALTEAKLKALRVLRELLRTCDDPTEKRRIAKAILDVKIPLAASKSRVQNNTEPAAAPKPAAPPISSHALGTLHLETHSLAILAGATLPHPDAAGRLPISLTPTGEPLQHGGPSIERPLPTPLGPQRA